VIVQVLNLLTGK